jgi:hypothetical protein
MKTHILLAVSALLRQVNSSRNPQLQWDPATAADCIEWADGYDGTCEEVRDYFTITPEQFRKWNPSLGLDCKPWFEDQSYCIVTQERLDNAPKIIASSSTTVVPTPTSSTTSLAPSPTVWTDIGCYVENPKKPVMDQNLSPEIGDSLTIPKCKDVCYHRAFEFAAVKEGNQCWCGTYVGAEWTKNQADCNIPCNGDKNTKCGGKDLLNVFKAKENTTPFSGTAGTASSTPRPSGTSIPVAVTTAAASSSTAGGGVASVSQTAGARRNRAMF